MRFDELERIWEETRACATAADLNGLGGGWNALEKAARDLRRSRSSRAGDVELFMAKRRRDLVDIVDRAWPRIERRLTNRDATRVITKTTGLGSETRTRYRIAT